MEEYQDHSLSGRVFQKIREDILDGKYKENDELRENTIGKELGVSRTPVREALRQLELEGLGDDHSQQGRLCDRDQPERYLGYLYGAVASGRIVRQMGHRTYHRETAR